MEDEKFSQPMLTVFLAEKQVPEIYPLVEKKADHVFHSQKYQ